MRPFSTAKHQAILLAATTLLAAACGDGAGTTDGTGGGDPTSNGAGGACESVSECSTVGLGPCEAPTCDDGACGVELVPAETVAAEQTAGDCATARCNAQGAIYQDPTPGDIEDDGNECTTDACSGDGPVHVAAPAGTHCGMYPNTTCDGTGQCLCKTAQDCGVDSDCATWSCNAGACSQSFVNGGVEVGPQTPHDCKAMECDGMGNLVPYIDTSDPPIAPQCYVADCTGGNPSLNPSPAGTPCSTGQCDGAGTCVAT